MSKKFESEISSINMWLSGSPEMNYGWNNTLVKELFGERARVCSELNVLHRDDVEGFLAANGRLESDYQGQTLHVVPLKDIGGTVFYNHGQGRTAPIALESDGPRVVVSSIRTLGSNEDVQEVDLQRPSDKSPNKASFMAAMEELGKVFEIIGKTTQDENLLKGGQNLVRHSVDIVALLDPQLLKALEVNYQYACQLLDSANSYASSSSSSLGQSPAVDLLRKDLKLAERLKLAANYFVEHLERFLKVT